MTSVSFPPVVATDRLASAYLFCLPETDRSQLIHDWLETLAIAPIDQTWLEARERISIGDVRQFDRDLLLLPVKSSRRVGIILFGEQLTLEASHALLKSLEDPPPHAVFLLGAESEDQVLPTIRSRCQRWRIQARARPTEVTVRQLSKLQKMTYRERFAIADAWTKGDTFLSEFDQLLSEAREMLLVGLLAPKVVTRLLELRTLATTNVTPRLLAEVVMLTLGKESV